MDDIIYVDSSEKLASIVQELKKEKELAIDIEMENNLHHYGMYVSVIQIGTREQQYLFDMLAIKDLGLLADLFTSPRIQKVFHDVSFDLRILHYQYNLSVRSIFDTKLAAQFLDKPHIGLGDLLEEYFSIQKIKKYQMADWTKRPLSKEMMAYAAKDTRWLLDLHEQLSKELEQKKFYEYYLEECLHLEEKDWSQKLPSFDSLKGFSSLQDVEKTLLEAYYFFRERLAEQLDKPPHFIISNKLLLEFAKHPPQTLQEWKKIRRVHPRVRGQAQKLHRLTLQAKEKPKTYLVKKAKRFTQAQRNHFAVLNHCKENVARKTSLPGFLIISKEQMQDIVLQKNLDMLRSWQKKLLLSICDSDQLLCLQN